MRWLKLVLLGAGLLGALGFFVPFLHDDGRPVTAREAMSRVEADRTLCDRPLIDRSVYLPPEACFGPNAPTHRSYIPFYFLAPSAMLLLAAIAILRRRLGGVLALLAVPAGMAAIGGCLREARVQHGIAIGAVLLAIAGVIGLAAAVAALIWREPVPAPRKPPIDLPEARVVSRP